MNPPETRCTTSERVAVSEWRACPSLLLTHTRADQIHADARLLFHLVGIQPIDDGNSVRNRELIERRHIQIGLFDGHVEQRADRLGYA
jgi:hypothetical protein